MTAEQFLISKSESKNKDVVLNSMNNGDYTIEMMVEFAKYHVEQALKEAANIADDWENSGELAPIIEEESYPLENIR